MDNHTTMSNDQSQMYWSPLMERYFIDLMLEQFQKRNKIGHTFNKEAWTDMQTMFNAKFGSKYDEDLKSQYAILWNTFNDVKNILSYKEFSWDGSSQKIVADEFFWDAYIKAHPNAQFYKGKSLQNFKDLCKIFSYTAADGRYSLSSHEACIDVEVQGSHLGDDGMGRIGTSSNERSKWTVWTPGMDKFFLNIFLEHLNQGNIDVNSRISKNAWTDMLTKFNAKFGTQHGKQVLRHRLRKLLKHFWEMTIILNKKGFSWDSPKQIIVADDDVWDACIKEHPYTRKYRLNFCPNYDDLELTFRNVSEDELSKFQKDENRKATARKRAGDEKGNDDQSCVKRSKRTYWTAPMDIFFIDLLLEQVVNGNKPGHIFTTTVWNNIVKSFNKHFKCQYAKEILRNRYNYMRKLFNEVHNLLQHSGFSWNATTEMVEAKDHVWDAYIKVHLEAKSIRFRNVSGYHKLCVIFGKGSSDTRNVSLSQNADSSVEASILITASEVEELNSDFMLELINDDVEEFSSNLAIDTGEVGGNFPCDDASTIEWTESTELLFIDLMVEQVNSGNKARDSFNEEAWIHMTKAFSTRFGAQCDKQFLEDRYCYLMKRHDNISNLLNENGFAVDFPLQMTLAGDEFWEEYLKENPEVILLKNTSLDRFSGLCKIFGYKISDERASDIVLQLQSMETNHISNELDMDGTYDNLHVFSNAEKSFPDAITKRLRQMHMDGTSENLGVIGNTEMPSSSNPPKEMLENLLKMDGSDKSVAGEKEDDTK